MHGCNSVPFCPFWLWPFPSTYPSISLFPTTGDLCPLPEQADPLSFDICDMPSFLCIALPACLYHLTPTLPLTVFVQLSALVPLPLHACLWAFLSFALYTFITHISLTCHLPIYCASLSGSHLYALCCSHYITHLVPYDAFPISYTAMPLCLMCIVYFFLFTHLPLPLPGSPFCISLHFTHLYLHLPFYFALLTHPHTPHTWLWPFCLITPSPFSVSCFYTGLDGSWTWPEWREDIYTHNFLAIVPLAPLVHSWFQTWFHSHTHSHTHIHIPHPHPTISIPPTYIAYTYPSEMTEGGGEQWRRLVSRFWISLDLPLPLHLHFYFYIWHFTHLHFTTPFLHLCLAFYFVCCCLCPSCLLHPLPLFYIYLFIHLFIPSFLPFLVLVSSLPTCV